MYYIIQQGTKYYCLGPTNYSGYTNDLSKLTKNKLEYFYSSTKSFSSQAVALNLIGHNARKDAKVLLAIDSLDNLASKYPELLI